jgi:hypothetical protein
MHAQVEAMKSCSPSAWVRHLAVGVLALGAAACVDQAPPDAATKRSPPADEPSSTDERVEANENFPTVARLFVQLSALGLACGYTRSAVLQWGAAVAGSPM